MDRLQWGNRKRLRCVKVKDSVLTKPDSNGGAVFKKKITSRVVQDEDESAAAVAHSLPPLQSPHRLNRDLGMIRSGANENRTPEKEDRYYTTRGSGGLVDEATTKLFTEAREEKKRAVWPKLFLALSNKEKEEDFMAMKGCKLPQRPKKRAKLIQRSLLLVSPGAWLSDLCQERYEVREKKTSKKVMAKKKPRGLKAMGSMESDSE